MKILSAQQIREADAATIADENITSADLMERASKVFSNWLIKYFPASGTYFIFCGSGNNGADGLCVARHLLQRGYSIQIFVIEDGNQATGDFKLNYNRLVKSGWNDFKTSRQLNSISVSENDIVIDALFGTGLNRKPEGIYRKVIEFMNGLNAIKISIDVPSGLFCDTITSGPCVNADYTLSFELPKLSFFFPENEKYTGEWEIKSIGLSKKYIHDAPTNFFYATEDKIRSIVKPRNKFDHKGTFGHSLIIAGSPGTTGAAELCAYACLAAGSGLVTLSSGDDVTVFPELMTVKRNEILENIKKGKYSVAGIGPGLGKDQFELLEQVIREFKQPLVLDADALNMISEKKELLQWIPENSVITPHPKEFERLFGKFESEAERIKKQIELSVATKLIIVYKRANTMITTPAGNCYFNSTGNPGMATAGSGDILTGIITALVAQKYSPVNAAILGVYLHGLAGDIALNEYGGQNLTAEDLTDYISTAFEFILNN